MNKLGRIYGIFDKKNSKFIYIGKTKNEKDFTPHGRHIKKLFFKYPDRYSYNIIEENIEEIFLNEKEKEYIKKYNTYLDKECYNYTEGGSGGDTFSGLTEFRKKIATKKRVKSNKKTKKTLEYKKKMKPIWEAIGKKNKEKLTGRKLSEEHKNKIREGIKKALEDPVKYNKISHKGKKKPPRTESHCKNISLALKGKKKSQEHIQKIKDLQKDKKKITDGVNNAWLLKDQIMPEGWKFYRHQ